MPFIPAVVVDVHKKLAPAGVELIVTAFVEAPEQTPWALIIFTVGFGLTLTQKVVGVPEQLFNVGVIV